MCLESKFCLDPRKSDDMDFAAADEMGTSRSEPNPGEDRLRVPDHDLMTYARRPSFKDAYDGTRIEPAQLE